MNPLDANIAQNLLNPKESLGNRLNLIQALPVLSGKVDLAVFRIEGDPVEHIRIFIPQRSRQHADSLVLGGTPEAEEAGTPEVEATVREVPKPTTRQVRPSSASRFPSVEVSRFQVVEDKEGKISFEKSEQQPALGSGTLNSPKLKRGPRPKKTDR